MKKVELKEICEIKNGYAFKSEDYKSEGTPLIRISNFNDSNVVLGDNTIYISPDFLKTKSDFIIEKGDILIALSGATTGKYGYYEYDFPSLLNQRVGLLKSGSSNELYDKYFYYYLNILKGEILRKAGGAAQPNISTNAIGNLQIPLPPLPTQKKIAAILDAADSYRQQTKKLIEKYDQLAQALFIDMFGDPVRNEKGWKVVKLEDVTTRITDGVHAKPNYKENGVPFISVKDITTGILKFDNCKFISKSDHDKFTKRCSPEYLDILYTKVGATYGRPAIIDTKNEFSIYVSVALIKPDHSKINAYFLKDALANPAVKRQADKSIKGIGVPDLHLNMIKQFLIPLPSLSTQKEFAEKIEAIEAQKQQAQSALQHAETLFQSLLQRAFNGKLGK
jgi:type I restriction enzyme S subunit